MVYVAALSCPAARHNLLTVRYECRSLLPSSSEAGVAQQVIAGEIRLRIGRDHPEVWCEQCGASVRPRIAIAPERMPDES